jgi:hypothetical protein
LTKLAHLLVLSSVRPFICGCVPSLGTASHSAWFAWRVPAHFRAKCRAFLVDDSNVVAPDARAVFEVRQTEHAEEALAARQRAASRERAAPMRLGRPSERFCITASVARAAVHRLAPTDLGRA